tara:strand:- start:145 stop:525 length:381 start_codon:yes stop_codon:yes gene_type:complete
MIYMAGGGEYQLETPRSTRQANCSIRNCSESKHLKSNHTAPSLTRPITGTGSFLRESANFSGALPRVSLGFKRKAALGKVSMGKAPDPIWLEHSSTETSAKCSTIVEIVGHKFSATFLICDDVFVR